MRLLVKLVPFLASMATASFANSSHFSATQPELTSGLISFLKVPLRVTLLVCWPKDQTASFIRQLSWPSRNSGRSLFVQAKPDSVENLRLLDTLEVHQQLAIVDVACPRTKELLGEARYRIYHRTRWLLLGGVHGWMADSERRVFDAVGSLPVTGSSEVFYFSEGLEGGKISIRNVFRISMNSGLISEEIGVWGNGTIEDKRSGRSVSVRRKNLQQLPLRTTLLYTDNYTLDHFDDYENPHIDSPNRLSYLMINSLYRNYLNASFVKRYSTTWCYPNPKTGGFMGVCVDLINNHSEVGAFMFITAHRLKLMDFLPMGIEGALAFLFKAPKLSIMNNIFQLPFDPIVWVCLLGMVFILGLIFVLMTTLEGWRIHPLHLSENSYDQLFNTISITLQQGSLLVSKSTIQRTVVLVSVIGFLFLYVSYSARIISLIQTPSEQINSLSELLRSRLEVGGHDIPYNHFYLTTSTEPVRKALYEQKIKRKDGSLNLYPLEEGVGRVQKGLFAMHVQVAAAEHVISETFDDTEKCYLRQLKFVDYSIIFLAVQRNFTFREHFQVGLARIRESGVFYREYVMIRLKAVLSCVKGTDFQPLSLVDIRFAMEIIGGGLLATVIVLAVEIGWNRYRLSRVPVFEYVD